MNNGNGLPLTDTSMGESDGLSPRGALLSKSICQTPRTDGAPCGAPPGEGGHCFWHDPSQRVARLEAASRGGSRRAVLLPVSHPLEPNEARGILGSVLVGLLQGAVDSTTARAAAYILQVERRIAEGAELDKRITTLEALTLKK